MPRVAIARAVGFLAAFEELEKSAWCLHHTPEGRYYFDRQENLTTGRPSQLASKALDMTRDTNRPFDGEAQIEKTLTSNPLTRSPMGQ